MDIECITSILHNALVVQEATKEKNIEVIGRHTAQIIDI
jgi:hypothetical protein